jgi:hypothetical protein
MHSFLLISATLAVAADPNKDPWVNSPYVDGDPFYSAEYENLEDCISQSAPAYRFDYNRPGETALRQIAQFVRANCAREVDALKKLIAPFERGDGPDDVTGSLDYFLLGPYFQSERLPNAPRIRQVDFESPAHSTRLGPDFRTTYLPSATGLRPGEVVAIFRWFDEPDAENDDLQQGFTYFGKIDGWSYEYRYHYGSWTGSVSNDRDSAKIECWRGDGGWIRNPAKLCSIKIGYQRLLRGDGLVSAVIGGNPVQILKYCNPGHVNLGDVIFRPRIDESSPLNLARSGKMSIDGKPPIAIPDNTCLSDRNQHVTSQLLLAHNVRTSYVPRFHNRTVLREGSPRILAPAMELAAKLHELTFNDRVARNSQTDLQTLWARSKPLTSADALPQRPEWLAAMRCLKRNRKPSVAGTLESTIEQLMSTKCKDWIEDLEWRAAGLNGAIGQLASPEKSETNRKAADTARQMLRKSAIDQSLNGPKPGSFAAGELETSLSGRKAKTGVAIKFSETTSMSLQEYAYSLMSDEANAIVPSARPHAFKLKGPELPLQSIHLTCRSDQKPFCEIIIPIDDGKGEFMVRTNGALHGSEFCVRYQGADFRSWRLSGGEYAGIEFPLSPDGCVTQRVYEALVMLAAERGPYLYAADERDWRDGRTAARSDFLFSLSLADYLADRLTH